MLLPLPEPSLDADRSPVYRVRAAGPALALAAVRRLPSPVCAAGPLADRYPVMRNSTVANMARFCVAYEADLRLPLAGVYFVEAIKLYSDHSFRRPQRHCTSWRSDSLATFTATVVQPAAVELAAGPTWRWQASAQHVEPTPVVTRTQQGGITECGRTGPGALRKAEQRPRSRGRQINEQTISQGNGYEWAWPDGRRASSPLPPGTCVVGDSQGRNLCLPHCRNHSEMCERVVNKRRAEGGCRFFRSNYAQHAQCALWSDRWRLESCEHVLVSLGAWNLRMGQVNTSLFGANFERVLRGLTAATQHRSVHVLPILEASPGCLITACPPGDWRTQPNVALFNVAAERAAAAAGVGYLGQAVLAATQPLWDTAPDWGHASARVLAAAATSIAEQLKAAPRSPMSDRLHGRALRSSKRKPPNDWCSRM